MKRSSKRRKSPSRRRRKSPSRTRKLRSRRRKSRPIYVKRMRMSASKRPSISDKMHKVPLGRPGSWITRQDIIDTFAEARKIENKIIKKKADYEKKRKEYKYDETLEEYEIFITQYKTRDDIGEEIVQLIKKFLSELQLEFKLEVKSKTNLLRIATNLRRLAKLLRNHNDLTERMKEIRLNIKEKNGILIELDNFKRKYRIRMRSNPNPQ